MNKGILIGNATRAAELRQTQSGKPVSNIRMATNRVVKGQETTQFHSVVWWDRLAEITAEYVRKGDPLYVEGRLEYRSYQDEEDKERGVCEVIAGDIQFLGDRRVMRQAEPLTGGVVSQCLWPKLRTLPTNEGVNLNEGAVARAQARMALALASRRAFVISRTCVPYVTTSSTKSTVEPSIRVLPFR